MEEIAKANEALNRAEKADNVGKLVTWLGLPAFIVELLFGLLPVLGLTLSKARKFVSGLSQHDQRKHNWATFGNVNLVP